ncbi:predicted protein [Naegleria gruberi]|uniref:Predicted protein n=1 Tax=Naegleria gruberi TaxID=5762 RepID=D2VU35_NAEGR|nr:uncharacterized protein NAEGRDRAFT_72522 [Naegleria gruberi]EFC39620.1 predicted protein [Naegleria gruberi]|eukprot:XP_002672364.1 predicted protein [Naegleria gruberi strain NEG-M]
MKERMQVVYSLINSLPQPSYSSSDTHFRPIVISKLLSLVKRNLELEREAKNLRMKRVENNLENTQFKKLMKNQVISFYSAAVQKFISIGDSFYYYDLVIYQFMQVLLCKNIERSPYMRQYVPEETNLIRECIGKIIRMNQYLDYSKLGKLFELILEELPKLDQFIEYSDDFIEKLFTFYKLKYPISILSILFKKYEFYEKHIPMITTEMIKNGVEIVDVKDDYLSYCLGFKTTGLFKKTNYFMKCLNQLIGMNQIIKYYENPLKGFTISQTISLYSTGQKYLRTFLQEFPFPIEIVSLENGNIRNLFNFFKVASERNFTFPMEQVKEAIKCLNCDNCREIHELVRYLMDKYQLTIYAIEEECKFFAKLMNVLRKDTALTFKAFNVLFPNQSVFEMSRISEHDQTFIINNVKELIIQIVNNTYPYEFNLMDQFLSRFSLPIIDAKLFIIIYGMLAQKEDAFSFREYLNVLYKHAWYDVHERMKDHVKTLLGKNNIEKFTDISTPEDFNKFGMSISNKANQYY